MPRWRGAHYPADLPAAAGEVEHTAEDAAADLIERSMLARSSAKLRRRQLASHVDEHLLHQRQTEPTVVRRARHRAQVRNGVPDSAAWTGASRCCKYRIATEAKHELLQRRFHGRPGRWLADGDLDDTIAIASPAGAK